MKVTSVSLLVTGLAAQQASATWGSLGDLWGSDYGYLCPTNADNECSDHQKSGWDWSGIADGASIGSSYSGFNLPGFTCSSSFGKRDVLHKRHSKCALSKITKALESAPKIECTGAQKQKGFSVDNFHVSTSHDTDVEFLYGMADGSQCKHVSRCNSGGSTIKNSQCGGATSVSFRLPEHSSQDETDFGIHSVGWECGSNGGSGIIVGGGSAGFGIGGSAGGASGSGSAGFGAGFGIGGSAGGASGSGSAGGASGSGEAGFGIGFGAGGSAGAGSQSAGGEFGIGFGAGASGSHTASGEAGFGIGFGAGGSAGAGSHTAGGEFGIGFGAGGSGIHTPGGQAGISIGFGAGGAGGAGSHTAGGEFGIGFGAGGSGIHTPGGEAGLSIGFSAGGAGSHTAGGEFGIGFGAGGAGGAGVQTPDAGFGGGLTVSLGFPAATPAFPTGPAQLTTSTIYSTSLSTSMSGSSEVVVTKTIAVGTTICPVTATQTGPAVTGTPGAPGAPGVPGFPNFPGQGEVTSYSTSTIYSTSLSTSLSGSSEVVVTQTIAVGTTICPVTATQTGGAGPIPSGLFPSGAIPTPSGSFPFLTPSGSFPGGFQPSGTLPAVSSVLGASSTTKASPTADCPGVLPKCLNTWKHKSSCKSNTDYECYCKDVEYTKNVMDCVSAWGIHNDEISQGLSYLVGICAAHIPENPGLITNCPSGITLGGGAPATSAPAVGEAPTPSSDVSGLTSAPAGSAPAGSAPAAGVSTVYATQLYTVTSCGPEVTNCPASSTAIKTSLVAISTTSFAATETAPVPAGSAPVDSIPAGSAPHCHFLRP
ncbi:uncharacterized protein K452DRAFT_295557 [Aplosporella prunicola CBS 121167]|uniref:CFEM domain-containing protein n=1 Tax=Aplosporella prunicola CBS 121167 TaxID=1176127 RepID=A0A6A6BLT2_9PEZI|nr:uncharacterized protein K452DRAFT_295557 [Aplosporella prunicola CBS 121167]KAF2144996.1 hypothetical protein K452DRAFT_295557 [Aplosporella prunicola CBS 121167]